MRKKIRLYSGLLSLLSVALLTVVLPRLNFARQVVPQTKPLRVKHVVVPILTFIGRGKVEVNLTTSEIIFTKTKDEGFLRIKLFRDFEDVAGRDYVYQDPHKVPLHKGDLYFVSISAGGDEMKAAIFQVSPGGRLQVIPLE